MNLKRNFLTILYAAMFTIIMGIGLFQIMNVTITTAASKYMIAGIIVLGLTIYLILAFLIKEGDYLRIFENNKTLPVILECFVIVGCLGVLFVIRSLDGMSIAILHSVLLLCSYFIGRMLMGRLNGIITTILGLLILLLMEHILPLDSNQTLSILCFFIPFAIFLAINRFLPKYLGKSGFLVTMSYLVLGFIFSLAIMINPLAVLLLAGCILSLLFARTEGEPPSILAKGIVCAGLLFFFSLALLFAAHILIPDLFILPTWQIDSSVPLSQMDVRILSFIANKFAKPLNYLQLAFRHGVIPTILVFFSILPGYYCISKKSSYCGPLLFSFVGLFAYYLLFCESGSNFYYVTYFLPIFSAYGITNTLLGERNNEELKETAMIQEEPVSEETDIPTPKPTPAPVTSKVSLPFPKRNEDEIPEWTIPNEYIETDEEHPSDFTDEQIPDIPIPSDVTDDSIDLIDREQLVEEELLDNNLSIDDDNAFLEFTDRQEEELANKEEEQLDELLERLDISDHIKRMNESAQEDMADVIEREEEQMELDEALPLKPSKSTLPKYKKPNFDFEIEPISIPLDDSYSNISEYDEVPTVHELESRWKSDESEVIETVAADLTESEPVHSEEIVKKNGIGKRSYHRITIR